MVIPVVQMAEFELNYRCIDAPVAHLTLRIKLVIQRVFGTGRAGDGDAFADAVQLGAQITAYSNGTATHVAQRSCNTYKHEGNDEE